MRLNSTPGNHRRALPQPVGHTVFLRSIHFIHVIQKILEELVNVLRIEITAAMIIIWWLLKNDRTKRAWWIRLFFRYILFPSWKYPWTTTLQCTNSKKPHSKSTFWDRGLIARHTLTSETRRTRLWVSRGVSTFLSRQVKSTTPFYFEPVLGMPI